MSGGRLPKRIAFRNLEGAVRRGRGGKEKEWTDCVQSDIRTFGIAGDWKAMALNAEVWVETVTEGGRRFMAAWRKEEVDAVFWTSMDVPAGVTQEEGNTGFSIHLLSAVLALIFLARRIQPFLSLVDREVEFCVLTI